MGMISQPMKWPGTVTADELRVLEARLSMLDAMLQDLVRKGRRMFPGMLLTFMARQSRPLVDRRGW